MSIRRTLADMIQTVVPKVAGGGLTLLLSLQLITQFSATEYGHYAYAVTLILLADAVIGTPFDLSVIRLAQTRVGAQGADALAIERCALGLKVLLMFVLGVALVVLSGPIGAGYGGLGSARILILTCAAALSLQVLRSVLLHLQLRQRFRHYGAVEIVHITVKLGPAFALALFASPTPTAILTALAIGPVLAIVVALFWVSPAMLMPVLSRQSISALARLLVWYSPTLALGATLSQLDILLLGVMVPAATLGQYGAATVIASVPSMLGMYLGIVLTPIIVKRAGVGTLRLLFLRVQLALTGAALLALFGIVALLRSSLPELLPPDYALAVPVFALLIPGSLLAMTTSAMALPLVLLARKSFMLRMDMVIAPMAILGFIWAIGAHGAMGAAAVTLAVILARSTLVLAAGWVISGERSSFG